MVSVDLGGPYVVKLGDVQQLKATVDPEDAFNHVEWDLNGDGRFTDTVGEYATFDTTFRCRNGAGLYPVSVRVSDSRGGSASTTVQIEVTT